MFSTVPVSEKLLIGDLNGHVGATNVGFEQVHGGFGYGSRSLRGGGCVELRVSLRLVDSEYRV